MHVLNDQESLQVSGALMLYVAMHDALADIHGQARLPHGERDSLMDLADRLSIPSKSIADAARDAGE